MRFLRWIEWKTTFHWIKIKSLSHKSVSKNFTHALDFIFDFSSFESDAVITWRNNDKCFRSVKTHSRFEHRRELEKGRKGEVKKREWKAIRAHDSPPRGDKSISARQLKSPIPAKLACANHAIIIYAVIGSRDWSCTRPPSFILTRHPLQ